MVRKIAITECKEGDILAFDVINNHGVTLVTKDTVLNQYIIERMIEFEVDVVVIFHTIPTDAKDYTSVTDSSEKEYFYVLLQTKKMLQELATGKPLDFQMVTAISREIYDNYYENDNLIRILSALKSKDDYTYTHSVNTAFYSMLIGKWLNLTELEINKAIISGLLHDIGKVKIPEHILNKSGYLTNEEYDIIKQHPILGYEMVKNIDELDRDVKKAILFHHERMNGSGYPYQIVSEEMNLYAKIVSLADVFDAMTSNRVYKKKVTPFNVFEMFETVGVSQFDTKLLKVFSNNIAVNLVGANVELSNGDTGEIVYIPLHSLTTPVIKVRSEYLDFSEQKTIKIMSII
jgi:putative nucleotidyltransferase with HDIG domain